MGIGGSAALSVRRADADPFDAQRKVPLGSALARLGTSRELARHWPGSALARLGTGPARHWPGSALARLGTGPANLGAGRAPPAVSEGRAGAAPAAVPCVHMRAVCEQQLHHRRVPFLAGPVQRRLPAAEWRVPAQTWHGVQVTAAAPAVIALRVRIGAVLEQQLRHSHTPEDSGIVERRAPAV